MLNPFQPNPFQTGYGWTPYNPQYPPEGYPGGMGTPDETRVPGGSVYNSRPMPVPQPWETGGQVYPFVEEDWPLRSFQQNLPPPPQPSNPSIYDNLPFADVNVPGQSPPSNPILDLLSLLRGVSPLGLGGGLGNFYYQQLMRDTYGPWTVQD